MTYFLVTMYIAHFLGDYTFYNYLFNKKNLNTVQLYSFHNVMYAIPHFIAWALLGFGTQNLLIVIMICLSHILVDLIKVSIQLKVKHTIWNIRMIYLLDQMIHYAFTFYLCTLAMINASAIIYSVPLRMLTIILLVTILSQPTFVSYHLLLSNKKNHIKKLSFDSIFVKMYQVVLGIALPFHFYPFIFILIIFAKIQTISKTVNDNRFIVFVIFTSLLNYYGLLYLTSL